jgi:hypothetical protein
MEARACSLNLSSVEVVDRRLVQCNGTENNVMGDTLVVTGAWNGAGAGISINSTEATVVLSDVTVDATRPLVIALSSLLVVVEGGNILQGGDAGLECASESNVTVTGLNGWFCWLRRSLIPGSELGGAVLVNRCPSEMRPF